jgi:hypothetical protein
VENTFQEEAKKMAGQQQPAQGLEMAVKNPAPWTVTEAQT